MADPTFDYGSNDYAIAGVMLAQLITQLADTRAGAPKVAVVHPGDVTPAYVELGGSLGCALAWTRISRIQPANKASQDIRGCVTETTVSVELGVYRCYPTPAKNAMPAPIQLDSLSRDTSADTTAMFRAAEAFADVTDLPTWVIDWRPQGPRGGVFGGLLNVSVQAGLGCYPDDVVPMLPEDPRATE